MIGALVAWSLRSRLVVVTAVVALIALGIRAALTLPIDAVPDVTNVQVQVLTSAPGLSPLEVESLVSRPVELAMSGLPGTRQIRSISRAGVSAVTLIFDDEIALADARSVVSQRLPAVRDLIPASAGRPSLGPLSTGLGEVYHITLRWPGHTLRDVRTVLDWEVAPGLRSVPGVVEVNGWGGETRQIEAVVRPADARALGVSLEQVERALLGGGLNAGVGAIERGGEQRIIRLDGQYRRLDDVAEQVVLTRPGGVPVRVKDVATVREGVALRTACATADGEGETVYAMVQMIAGGNAHEVVGDVKVRLDEIRKRLPEGVSVDVLYDRAALVDRVLHTVTRSLVEGGVVVVAVLLLLLGDFGAGVVVATTIPISMLGAVAMMRVMGISGNLMSLGAIDFGLVVDGAVVVVEGTLAGMAVTRSSAEVALAAVGREVGRPIALGVVIVGAVYVPVLMLQGVEGRMFRPMGWTVLFALGTALVLAFTWVPVLASILLRRVHDHEAFSIRWARKIHEPLLAAALRRPVLAVVAGLLLTSLGLVAAWGRGTEFVPRLEEGDLVVQVTRPPSVSLSEAARGTQVVERTLKAFPEVNRVVSRTGSPDVATDVMGIEQSDVFVLLKPRASWTTAHDREGLVAAFDVALRRDLPGTAFSYTQPIEMRVQELLAGLRSDVGVRVHGDDLVTLRSVANDISKVMSSTPGAADVRIEPTAGLPLTTIRLSPERMGRLGVSSASVRAAIEALRVGRPVGNFVEGERRFDVVLRIESPSGPEPDLLAATPLPLEIGTIPLGAVADVIADDAPAQISREQARRRVMVESNVRGRDLGSFVSDLKTRLDSLKLPSGYHISVSSQAENLQQATARLAIIVPLTLAAIFMLLHLTFGESRSALVIFLNIPAAVSGGLVALAFRDLPVSISSAVGFIALSGVATLNGVVLLTSVRRLEREGASPLEAARGGARERLRPVLTTAVVAALGFVPMALATGTGAEVQRPLATVVIGGLISSTFLTLIVVPAVQALLPRSTPLPGPAVEELAHHPSEPPVGDA